MSYSVGRLRRARRYRRLMRATPVSRPCYDKMHRCPGWAGGGTRYARVNRCDDGRLVGGLDGTLYEGRHWYWRFNRCDTCDVLVLPYVVRYVDYRWWIWQVQALRWPLTRRLWWPVEDRWLRWRHRENR